MSISDVQRTPGPTLKFCVVTIGFDWRVCLQIAVTLTISIRFSLIPDMTITQGFCLRITAHYILAMFLWWEISNFWHTHFCRASSLINPEYTSALWALGVAMTTVQLPNEASFRRGNGLVVQLIWSVVAMGSPDMANACLLPSAIAAYWIQHLKTATECSRMHY